MSEMQLRDALRSATADIEVEPVPWDEIEDRAAELRTRRRRFRTVVAGSLAAVAAVAAVLLAAGVSRNDGRELRAVDPGPTALPGPDTTASPDVTADGPPDVAFPVGMEAIWPITSQEDLDLHLATGSTEYDDPARTAKAFLHTYVGINQPEVGEPSEESAGPGGQQVTFPATGVRAATPPRMQIVVAEVAPGGPWTVVSLRSDKIVVDEPAAGSTARSPLFLRGKAAAYEGTVNVEVREDGQTSGQRLGESFVTGRGDGVLGDFTGNIAFRQPTKPAGAVVFLELSAEDGAPIQATVVRVRFGS